MELRAAVANTLDAAKTFFDFYYELCSDKKEKTYRIFKTEKYPDPLSPRLADLSEKLQNYIEDQDDNDYRMELSSMLDRCEDKRLECMGNGGEGIRKRQRRKPGALNRCRRLP